MSKGIEPHGLDETGFIVAWRSKKLFEAGKYLDEVMTFGEATKKAEELSAGDASKTYWAERQPQHFEPH
jgi:hypothetical protein